MLYDYISILSLIFLGSFFSSWLWDFITERWLRHYYIASFLLHNALPKYTTITHFFYYLQLLIQLSKNKSFNFYSLRILVLLFTTLNLTGPWYLVLNRNVVLIKLLTPTWPWRLLSNRWVIITYVLTLH